MKYRKLRIAWSVGWGVVAVLLAVVWIQSFNKPVSLALSNHRATVVRGAAYLNESFDVSPNLSRPFPNSLTMTTGASIKPSGKGFSLPLWSLVLTVSVLGVLPNVRWRL